MTPSHIRVSRGTTRRRTSALSVGSLPADSRAVWRSEPHYAPDLVHAKRQCRFFRRIEAARDGEGARGRILASRLELQCGELAAVAHETGECGGDSKAKRPVVTNARREFGTDHACVDRIDRASCKHEAGFEEAVRPRPEPPFRLEEVPGPSRAQPAMAGMRCASKACVIPRPSSVARRRPCDEGACGRDPQARGSCADARRRDARQDSRQDSCPRAAQAFGSGRTRTPRRRSATARRPAEARVRNRVSVGCMGD